MNTERRWADLISAVSDSAAMPSAAERAALLADALGLGHTVTNGAVECSVTESTAAGFRTPSASGPTALELDLAQYATADGPCVAACRDGQSHSIPLMTAESRYPELTAAAMVRGVRSSLSLPLAGTDHPAALNLYADSDAAFAQMRARAVAGLLGRCVARLLTVPTQRAIPPPLELEIASARTKGSLIQRAQRQIAGEDASGAAAAYLSLTLRSRTENRSIFAVADDIVAATGNGDTEVDR